MAMITHVDIRMVDLKPKTVRTDAIQSFVSQETPIVRITDADGVVGTGYTYTIGTGGSSVVALLRDHLAPQLIGRDANDIEAIWRDLLFSSHATSVGAITSLSLAAIDTALWDLQSRKTGIALYQLAGGAKDKIPLYTTEGGWLQLEQLQLVDDAVAMKARGFGGAKIKVGKPRGAEDVARLQAVRAAVGNDFEIMTDANQGFDLAEAIRRARLFEPIDIAWFEEPLPADNVLAHQRLAASTSLPVAVGESMYSIGQFREYLAMDACSIVQVDVARIGGITPWLKVAHLAESFDVAVCPHFLMELHVSLCCAVPNSRWLEYIPQLDSLTHRGLDIVDGHAVPSNQPGLGIDWDWDAIDAQQMFTPITISK